jgi:hypothetical protein
MYKEHRRKVIFHAVSDIISGHISGLFLPGTILASSTLARENGLVEQEFYFKRAFNERNIKINYPTDYKDKARAYGLHFGKKNKLKTIIRDIKYLSKKSS